MFESKARVETAAGSKYLVQLCKHFAHKITVEYGEGRGRAQFPFGLCLMTAEPDALHLCCQAEDAEALARIEWILTDHLQRFAWREKPAITFSRDVG
ncbi:DUF2218 domain-containing protein [Arenibaculum pallidiluteum]|uniref:DUF2218 domain-containing protein n=1 Tax=Arenibaculum pallidiluteum TaxID=2812559 RepID=UPI001A97079B|nr:DUF2218 domain-containing protein [Arenibaculum pallidiluteum]